LAFAECALTQIVVADATLPEDEMTHPIISTIAIRSPHLSWLETGTILLVRHGSHAYGTNTPESDEDFKGVAVPPKPYFLGTMHRFEQAVLQAPDPDVVIYDIRKFINLAADCNPSIIEVLWTYESDHIVKTPLGQLLVNSRHNFLSKRIKFTFMGYAVAQLKRIKSHRNWLLNPPKAKPTRAEFGLSEMSRMTKTEFGAAGTFESPVAMKEAGIPDSIVEAYIKERDYNAAKRYYDQYMNWKATRNPKRAAIEEQFGYDCKHAGHLVRLILMAGEAMSTGQVIVKRPDRDELLAIRNGAWSYDRVIEFAEKSEADLDKSYAECNVLPREPDREFLDRLCVQIVEQVIR
jgi:uncharacterized protein